MRVSPHPGRKSVQRDVLCSRLLLPAAFVLTALVQGCASQGSFTEPAPTGRMEFKDFSIVVPPGAGWNIRRSADGALLRRMLESPSHTQVAVAAGTTDLDPAAVGYPTYATDPEVFVRYVRASAERTRNADPESSRYVVLTDEITADSRFGHCARTHLVSEDHKPATGDAMLVTENWGYTCLKPTDPKVLIQIGFSERSAPGQQDANLQETREAFFNGFRFTTPIAPGPPTADIIHPVPETPALPPTTPADAATPALLVLSVDTALRDVARKGFKQAAPGLEMVLEGEPRAAEAHRELRLSFSADVDRSRQSSNLDGASILGPAGLLLGVVTPWACTVTHHLHASLVSAGGVELRTWDISHKDKHVGTMLACPDVEKPEKDAILEMEADLVRRLQSEGLLAN